MAVSFIIQSVGANSANIQVKPDPNYPSYRVYVRLSSSSSAVVYDRWFDGISYTISAFVDGLAPGTSYTVNVAYNTSPTANGAVWVGAQTFTTDGGGVDPPGGNYYVNIVFNVNGGVGGPGSKLYTGTTQYISVTIPTTRPSRSGYDFLGWAFSQSATTPNYLPGQTDNAYWAAKDDPSYTQTLYAVWSKKQTSGAYIGQTHAAVYIFAGGWKKAVPYVRDGGTWKKGI